MDGKSMDDSFERTGSLEQLVSKNRFIDSFTSLLYLCVPKAM